MSISRHPRAEKTRNVTRLRIRWLISWCQEGIHGSIVLNGWSERGGELSPCFTHCQKSFTLVSTLAPLGKAVAIILKKRLGFDNHETGLQVMHHASSFQ